MSTDTKLTIAANQSLNIDGNVIIVKENSGTTTKQSLAVLKCNCEYCAVGDYDHCEWADKNLHPYGAYVYEIEEEIAQVYLTSDCANVVRATSQDILRAKVTGMFHAFSEVHPAPL